MIFKNKAISIIALLICVCFLAVASIVDSPRLLQSSSNSLGGQQIILDAGHDAFANTIDWYKST